MYNDNVFECNQANLKYSDGLIHHFIRRLTLRAIISHGKNGKVNESASSPAVQNLKQLLSSYARKDRYSADEFGLNSSMPLSRTVHMKRFRVGKLQRNM